MRPTARRATASEVQPLRTRILRPTFAAGQLATYPEDDAPTTVHLLAEDSSGAAAVGTIYAEAPPEALVGEIPEAAYADGAAWRLRGMASRANVRGQGFGAAVLASCDDAVREAGAAYLWCNARLVAVPFYARHGWQAVGPEFDIPGIGPHFVMWKAVHS